MRITSAPPTEPTRSSPSLAKVTGTAPTVSCVSSAPLSFRTSEPASAAGTSLPKSTVIVPAALALPVEVTSPARPLSALAPESPSSSTVTSSALRICGAESATSVIVAVATSVSPSPSVMRYWKLTVPLSCAAGV